LSEENIETPQLSVTRNEAGIVRRIKQIPNFVASVRKEMQLVYRPSWQEVRSTTLLVFVFLFLFELYLCTFDLVFAPLDRWLFPR
jgi:preprotein translocase SecE subunit